MAQIERKFCPISVQSTLDKAIRFVLFHGIDHPSTLHKALIIKELLEALTAVQVGLLTVYDMCKAVDRGMVMTDVKVLEKHGGMSGDWVAGQ